MVALMARSQPVMVEDMFAVSSVATAANKAVRLCVMYGTHLGGSVLVGPKEEFVVAVVQTGFFGGSGGRDKSIQRVR